MGDETTQEIHERAGFGHGVALGVRPAVLVVDLSRGFTDPGCALGSDLTAVVEATNRVLAVAREAAFPVVFTTIGFEANLKDGSLWLQKVPTLGELRIGGKWVEINPRLGRREEETVILKKGPSAFFGTNLASIFVSQGVHTVGL